MRRGTLLFYHNDGTIELAQLVNSVEEVFQLKAFLEFPEMA